MLLGQSAEELARVRALATQAREPAPHYEHTRIGHNYRLSNIATAIGRGQLTAIEDRLARRRPLWKPMHLQPVFAPCPAHGSGVSESRFTRGLCLPSGTGMSEEGLEQIIACLLPPAGGR